MSVQKWRPEQAWLNKQWLPFGAKICTDICPRPSSVLSANSFRERSPRKTVSFEEQIMSKGKYPSIFLKPNGGFKYSYT